VTENQVKNHIIIQINLILEAVQIFQILKRMYSYNRNIYNKMMLYKINPKIKLEDGKEDKQ
jgi:hypothetical protein